MLDAEELARVVRCTRCTTAHDASLDRDERNIPQPGFVGLRYAEARVLLVGQNPAQPKTSIVRDEPYMEALRALGDAPTDATLAHYREIVRGYVGHWPITQSYFPLAECGLTLDDIAYCNLVRCRTRNDAAPGMYPVAQCVGGHFERWLSLLAPRVVVFIGVWPAERGGASCVRRGIPYDWINRDRSLSGEERRANRARVATTVRQALGRPITGESVVTAGD